MRRNAGSATIEPSSSPLRFMRKISSICFLLCLLATGGCSLPVQPTDSGAMTRRDETLDDKARPADERVPESAPGNSAGERNAVRSPSTDGLPRAESPISPRPDAVIEIDLGAGKILPEMGTSLAAIAEQAKSDERILIRLESYVSDGGSPALNLGLTEINLQKVKERLVGLGISPKRIFLSNYGEEHSEAGDRHRYWVEIYLLRSTSVAGT